MDKEAIVAKSNALVEASYRLTVYEQRILLACISQIRRDQQITDEVMYTVHASDVAKVTGTSTASAYRELNKAALKLKRREVSLVEEPNGKGHKPEVLVTGWVQSIAYASDKGLVRLRFNKDILPYVNMLTEQFTRYALGDVAKMSSSYAIRMYELLAQWSSSGERTVEVSWLRKVLQTDDKYPLVRDFKKWVVKPAIDQINDLSPLWVEWDQKKNGRTITHLTFRFGIKESAQPGKDSGERIEKSSWYGIPSSTLEKRANPGETYEQCALRLLEEAKKSR